MPEKDAGGGRETGNLFGVALDYGRSHVNLPVIIPREKSYKIFPCMIESWHFSYFYVNF